MVETISPEKIVNPYIVAVLDETVTLARLKENVSKLPGVLNVIEKSQIESQGRIKSLMSQLGSDYGLRPELMNFKTVRISLNPSLSQDSMTYIRNQILNIGGGKDHLNVTNVKYPEVTGIMKSHPFYSFIAVAGDWGIVGVIAIFWIISFWLIYQVFRSRSYIIEKFQRKKYVASKAMASGLGLVVILFSGLGLLNGTLKFFDLLLLLMVFSVFWTFSMQDWRWKPTL